MRIVNNLLFDDMERVVYIVEYQEGEVSSKADRHTNERMDRKMDGRMLPSTLSPSFAIYNEVLRLARLTLPMSDNNYSGASAKKMAPKCDMVVKQGLYPYEFSQIPD